MSDALEYAGLDWPEDDIQFALITRCLDHPETAEKTSAACSQFPGMYVDDVPIICQRPTGHDKRHVYENGGHACWELTEDGYATNATIRGFVVADR